MTFTPELGQFASGSTFTAVETPGYVTDGFGLLDALYAERFEGGQDLLARVANHGGSPVVTDVFELRPYCWCDGERHPDGCPPNFRHLPTGFEAHWYKHSHRSPSCSDDISAAAWAQILAECVQSIENLPPAYRVLISGSRDFGADLRVPGSKSRFRDDWASVPSAQRDAMVAALRGARERAGDRPMLVIAGDANGADRLAAALARRSDVPVEEWPALWRREDGTLRGGYDRAEALRVRSVYNPGGGYYPKAGPERNQAMVNAGADECLAFLALGATNRGTRHCMGIAAAAGIPVTATEA